MKPHSHSVKSFEDTEIKQTRTEWTLCRVMTGRESAVADCLADLDYEVYVPKVDVWARPAGKRSRELVKRPVFPGYILVAGTPWGYGIELPIAPVIFGDRIALLSSSEVAEIKRRLDGGRFDHRETSPHVPFDVGDRVKVTAGPFSGLEGYITLLPSNGEEVRLHGADILHATWISIYDVAGMPEF